MTETKLADVIAEVPKKEDDVPKGVGRERAFDTENWKPVTRVGKLVKAKKIISISELLDKGVAILEAEIVDALIPNLKSDLILIGQSKGKFGGGKRSIWRQTQKKTNEGNKPKFSALAVVGNSDGYVGIGLGKARETVPAREKATRQAKINIIKIRRGCGSWESAVPKPTSIPFTVEGKCGSVKVKLIPAPQGTGLVIEKECRKVLAMAGIGDVYSMTYGHTGTKLNLITACFNALKKLSTMKVNGEHHKQLGIVEGSRL